MRDSLRGRAGFAAGGAHFEQSEVVIYLAVDYNDSIARLTERRQCARRGDLYDIVSHPPQADGLRDLGVGR